LLKDIVDYYLFTESQQQQMDKMLSKVSMKSQELFNSDIKLFITLMDDNFNKLGNEYSLKNSLKSRKLS